MTSKVFRVARDLARRMSERRWRQITITLKTGERQVWHNARLCRRSPHVWTGVLLKDGRMMLYPKDLIARVGVGRGANYGKTKIFG